MPSGKLSEQEQSNNPLRKEYYNKYQQEQQRWNEMVRKLIGTKVVWQVKVYRINEQGVQIHAYPRSIREDDVEVKVHFAESSRFREDSDGRLILGQNITLEEAKQLDVNSFLWVHGVIEQIESSVDGRYGDYINIGVYRTRAELPRKSPGPGPKT